MNYQLIICFLLLLSPVFGQNKCMRFSDKAPRPMNSVYAGIGRQGTSYLKYERKLYQEKLLCTFVNLGFQWTPGSKEYDILDTKTISPEIGVLLGKKDVLLEVGVEPATSFRGPISYCDVNCVFGLRYNPGKKQRVLLQAGFYRKMLVTYKGSVKTFTPFYAGIGANF